MIRVKESERDSDDEDDHEAPKPAPAPLASGSTNPTLCILLTNMFESSEVDLKREPGYFIEIEEQVLDLCEEIGQVDQVWVDESKGNVWIKFSPESLEGAIQA
jgi:hypothetical protein